MKKEPQTLRSSNENFKKDISKAYKRRKSAGLQNAGYQMMKQMPHMLSNPAIQNGGGPLQAPGNFAAANANSTAMKMKKSKKRKVSNVLQESSMCKKCKTSHKPGMHKVAKKKR